MRIASLAILLMVLTGCVRQHQTKSWHAIYSYANQAASHEHAAPLDDFFLLFLVDAKHLDYSDSQHFFRTLAKHPQGGTKNSDVGHAWVLLSGIVGGKRVILEGGHSGELGVRQPRYFTGVMNFILYGYPTPPGSKPRPKREEPNPIRYLFAPQKDGFFQRGSGGHKPSCVAKIPLTEEQFYAVADYIKNYDYSDYRLLNRQCTTFVADIAELLDFPLEHQVTVVLSPTLRIAKKELTLFRDPKYSTFTVSTPDKLEESLIHAIKEGRAKDFRIWYLQHYRHQSRRSFKQSLESITRFPSRMRRLTDFSSYNQ